MTVKSPLRGVVRGLTPPSEPSGAFIEAVENAYENLARRGIHPITPFDIWNRMELTGEMEGTLADILAWDKDRKPGKQYPGLIEQLIADGKCRYLLLETQRGQKVVVEEIPF